MTTKQGPNNHFNLVRQFIKIATQPCCSSSIPRHLPINAIQNVGYLNECSSNYEIHRSTNNDEHCSYNGCSTNSNRVSSWDNCPGCPGKQSGTHKQEYCPGGTTTNSKNFILNLENLSLYFGVIQIFIGNL